jgi:uncharacterized membrane protein
MKCITFGVAILLILLLIMFVQFLHGPHEPSIREAVIILIGMSSLATWWLLGWFSSCPDGYLMSNIQKPRPGPTMIVEKQ